ncbi:MAG: CDP-diacylglycerol--glycerol-3-phosphate 3-phosphatidyltransferase, partial [Actinomycetota bacterium]
MPVDPNAVTTWANLVTVLRVLMAPVVFVLIPSEQTGHWGAFALWFVLCLSDSIDGHLARRHGATNLGAFLDPLADKVLV